MTNPEVSLLDDIPLPPDYDIHIREDYSFQEVWDWIGPKMFYNKILGYKGNYPRDLANKTSKALQLNDDVVRIQDFVQKNNFNLMLPKAMWKFFRTKAKGNDLIILDDNLNTVSTFSFPRQKKNKELCLTDYIDPKMDSICFFVCTTGNKISDFANLWIDEGRYQDAFILQGLALATAEALAEIVHRDIRISWGFPDSTDMQLIDIMLAKYRGCRYSFGYPACPNLKDQQKLWQLINPEKINIKLTDGFMMDPEASVSAIVFHHPEAKYFSV
jgi:5-methyltetrahydrofolate--homocysteine methyltransferase